MRVHHFVQFCCFPMTHPPLSWGKLSITVKTQKGYGQAKISQVSEDGLLLQVIQKGIKGMQLPNPWLL